MTATFPGGVKNFTAKQDGVDKIYASHVNDLQDEVMAIEQKLIDTKINEKTGRVAGMVYFNPPSTHPDYTGATFAVGTHTVNANTKFGVPLGATGVIVLMSARWDVAAQTSVMALRAKGDNANCVVSRALVGGMSINSNGSVPINESGEFDLYFGGAAPKNQSVVVNIVGYVI